MGVFKIKKISNDLEILSKIANSLAKKYNCSVNFNKKMKKAKFSGDDKYRHHIAEELIGLLRTKES